MQVQGFTATLRIDVRLPQGCIEQIGLPTGRLQGVAQGFTPLTESPLDHPDEITLIVDSDSRSRQRVKGEHDGMNLGRRMEGARRHAYHAPDIKPQLNQHRQNSVVLAACSGAQAVTDLFLKHQHQPGKKRPVLQDFEQNLR